MNDIMNGILNDKEGQNIVNDSFGQKPDGLLMQFFGITLPLTLSIT